MRPQGAGALPPQRTAQHGTLAGKNCAQQAGGGGGGQSLLTRAPLWPSSPLQVPPATCPVGAWTPAPATSSQVTNNVGSQRPRGSRHADGVHLAEACPKAHKPWRTTNQVRSWQDTMGGGRVRH